MPLGITERLGDFALREAAQFAGKRLRNFGKNLFTQESDSELTKIPEIIEGSTPTLYIHIPFCHAPLCEMCPFFRIEFHQSVAERYVEDLRNELSKYSGINFPSVYIGGGTPATILPELTKLIEEFGIGYKELSIEAHPSDLTSDNIKLMKNAGVTRLSVGVQSFDEKLLAQMKRNNGKHSIENIRRAAEVFTVNADLIYNFAGQTIEQFENDLDILIDLGVSQITCYPLMAAPGQFNTVDESKESEFYKAMLRKFSEAGYKPLTPWCFTNAPEASQGEYISSPSGDEYLGIGASAISKIGSVFKINAFNLANYHELASAGQNAAIGIKRLSKIEDAQYFLLTNLFGMHLDLNNLTGDTIKDKLIWGKIKMLKVAGLVSIDNSIVSLTESGMLFFSKAMKDFYTGLNFFREQHKNRASEA